jgi:hypothetical protein
MSFEYWVGIWNAADLAALLGFVGVIVTLAVNARRSLKVQRVDTYMKLELEASRVFEIIRNNKGIIDYLNDDRADNEEEKSAQFKHSAEWLLAQVLNLFEMSVVFRKRGIFEDNLFVTWVAWYYEVGQYKRFPEFWESFEPHYRLELRQIINLSIQMRDAPGDKSEEDFFSEVSRILKAPAIKTYHEDFRKTKFSMPPKGA